MLSFHEMAAEAAHSFRDRNSKPKIGLAEVTKIDGHIVAVVETTPAENESRRFRIKMSNGRKSYYEGMFAISSDGLKFIALGEIPLPRQSQSS